MALPFFCMITVHVKLFATLRLKFPKLGIGETMPVVVPDGYTAGQLIDLLKLPPGQKIIFINNKIQKEDFGLQDGDRIGIFPPVGGG